MTFPKHLSLTLSHNEHKNYYQTVEESISLRDHGYRDTDWVSPEQRQKAIDTDDCWTLQWYPDTPVGFNILAAADLDVLMDATRECQAADTLADAVDQAGNMATPRMIEARDAYRKARGEVKINMELMNEFIQWYQAEHPDANMREIRDAWVDWVQGNRMVFKDSDD